MSELAVITTALEQVARRRRLAQALRGLWLGLLIGASLSLLILAIFHLYPLPLWCLPVAGILPLLFMLGGLVWGGWRKLSLAETARWVDDRQRLKERLSSAMEFASEPEAGQWKDLIVADAASHAGEIDPRRLLPLRLPRQVRWALVVLVLGAGLGFVPEYRSKAHLQKQIDQANIQEIGRQVAELTKRSLEKRPPVMEPTEKSLEAVIGLGDELSRQKLTRSDALRELASASERIKDQLDSLAKDPALKRLEQAARRGGGGSQSPAELQKQIDSMQKELGSPSSNPEAIEKLRQDLEKMQEAARGMAGKDPAGAEADRQKLADALTAMSRQAQDMGLNLPQLDQALAALAANNPELFLKNLENAASDLEKTREMARTLQQLQQQMQQMGKDLGEQLKNGQPEAAQETLEKMAKQLQAANLSPEQLQKLMEEVSQAVDPAGNYENVAELLKQAASQMKQGDKQEAAESLQAAAKELKKLMDQMGDAQQLAEAMQALEKASQCIGSCQGWGAGRQPGFKPGGKPGSGVGTWADENEDWLADQEMSGGWDNSDVLRPDMDPRGLADRGPGEVSKDLSPAKVKGQFSPGAQMPSIALKGVSIKGQSKVAFEESAAAAQSDAENALSQDKVPRAYQNAVRDYFDDLKK